MLKLNKFELQNLKIHAGYNQIILKLENSSQLKLYQFVIWKFLNAESRSIWNFTKAQTVSFNKSSLEFTMAKTWPVGNPKKKGKLIGTLYYGNSIYWHINNYLFIN